MDLTKQIHALGLLIKEAPVEGDEFQDFWASLTDEEKLEFRTLVYETYFRTVN